MREGPLVFGQSPSTLPRDSPDSGRRKRVSGPRNSKRLSPERSRRNPERRGQERGLREKQTQIPTGQACRGSGQVSAPQQ